MKRNKAKRVTSLVAALAMLLLALSGPLGAKAATDDGGYLIAYFRSDPSQTGEKIMKLHYGYSRDGIKFYELNGNRPVANLSYALRDPFLDKGPDGIWRLVYTTPDVDANGNSHATYYAGYAESTDLIHWTNQKRLDVMQNYRPANTVYNVWAPEWVYNDETGKYILFWSSTLNANGPSNNKHYKATTTDWNTFSNASILFDPGVKTIDANIVRYDKNGEDYYYLFYKDENASPMKIKQTWASEPVNKIEYENPSHISSTYITSDYTEGPEVFKLIGQNKWHLIYDYWSQGKYGLKTTTNIEDPLAWSAENTNARFPFKMRHASVADVSEAELWSLIETYSLEAHYKLDAGVVDASGNGHGGTLVGSPAYTGTGGKLGGYLNFDGIDDGVQLAGSSAAGFLHDAMSMRTVSLWFQAGSTSGTQVLYEEGGASNGFAVKIDNGKLMAGVASNDVRASVSTAFTDTSAWHHAAAVYREGVLALYVDGVLKASSNTGIPSIGAHSDFGGLGKRFAQDAFNGTNDDAYFQGKMDQVKLFDVPLFDQDIVDLYQTP